MIWLTRHSVWRYLESSHFLAPAVSIVFACTCSLAATELRISGATNPQVTRRLRAGGA